MATSQQHDEESICLLYLVEQQEKVKKKTGLGLQMSAQRSTLTFADVGK